MYFFYFVWLKTLEHKTPTRAQFGSRFHLLQSANQHRPMLSNSMKIHLLQGSKIKLLTDAFFDRINLKCKK